MQNVQELARSVGFPSSYRSAGRAIRIALATSALVMIGIGIGSSSLTFAWVRQHDIAGNFFPEFAGGVIYLSDVFLAAGLTWWVVVRLLYWRVDIWLGTSDDNFTEVVRGELKENDQVITGIERRDNDKKGGLFGLKF